MVGCQVHDGIADFPGNGSTIECKG